jgi:hypothetical protein
MDQKVVVQIIGAQVACPSGLKDTWRELAEYTRRQLDARYKGVYSLEYFDLFDPGCPPLPPDAQLPYVTIAGEEFSSGGKLNIPAIRKKVAEFLEAQG